MWQAPDRTSHKLHRGVACPLTHVSEGMRSAAMQSRPTPSQKLPVYRPQSMQGLHSSFGVPNAYTSMVPTLAIGGRRAAMAHRIVGLGSKPTAMHTRCGSGWPRALYNRPVSIIAWLEAVVS